MHISLLFFWDDSSIAGGHFHELTTLLHYTSLVHIYSIAAFIFFLSLSIFYLCIYLCRIESQWHIFSRTLAYHFVNNQDIRSINIQYKISITSFTLLYTYNSQFILQ